MGSLERTLRRETLDAEIHATLTRAVELKAESERLLQKLPDLKAARNALVPIESLPVEVLTAILALVPRLPLDGIMFVSRRWYTICTSSAVLWREFHEDTWNARRIALAVKYSKNNIRSLEIGWLDVLVASLRMSPTLRSITISGDEDSMSFFADTLSRLDLPNVGNLSLTQARRGSDIDDYIDPDMCRLVLPRLPVLKAFSLSRISMLHTSWRSLHGLTKLHLSSCYPLGLPLLFCVLRQSPNLRSLKLEDALSQHESPQDLPDDPQPIHLAGLENLDVCDEPSMLDEIISRITFPWTTSVALSTSYVIVRLDHLDAVLAVARQHMRAAEAFPGQRTGDTLRIETESNAQSAPFTLEVYSSTAKSSIFRLTSCAFSVDEGAIILALLDVITGPQTSHLDLVNTRRALNSSWDTILSRLPPPQKISLNPSHHWQCNLSGLFRALCNSTPETLPTLEILDIHFVHPDSLDLTFLASLLDFLVARQSACGEALPQMHITIPTQQKGQLFGIRDGLTASMDGRVGNLEWNLVEEEST
ncbi:hypothetical protein C8F01DRAFT_690407 [Mycena amicta]|nr:hypothetical protein C8F01DRAFT_690407 [Mycena amicta]